MGSSLLPLSKKKKKKGKETHSPNMGMYTCLCTVQKRKQKQTNPNPLAEHSRSPQTAAQTAPIRTLRPQPRFSAPERVSSAAAWASRDVCVSCSMAACWNSTPPFPDRMSPSRSQLSKLRTSETGHQCQCLHVTQEKTKAQTS